MKSIPRPPHIANIPKRSRGIKIPLEEFINIEPDIASRPVIHPVEGMTAGNILEDLILIY